MADIEISLGLVILVFLFGFTFFFVELYHEKIHLNDSIIAEISLRFPFI
ncbi:MAG: hypothetical protein ACTSPA_16045 [Promethearchaeota archaeon]